MIPSFPIARNTRVQHTVMNRLNGSLTKQAAHRLRRLAGREANGKGKCTRGKFSGGDVFRRTVQGNVQDCAGEYPEKCLGNYPAEMSWGRPGNVRIPT